METTDRLFLAKPVKNVCEYGKTAHVVLRIERFDFRNFFTACVSTHPNSFPLVPNSVVLLSPAILIHPKRSHHAPHLGYITPSTNLPIPRAQHLLYLSFCELLAFSVSDSKVCASVSPYCAAIAN